MFLRMCGTSTIPKWKLLVTGLVLSYLHLRDGAAMRERLVLHVALF